MVNWKFKGIGLVLYLGVLQPTFVLLCLYLHDNKVVGLLTDQEGSKGVMYVPVNTFCIYDCNSCFLFDKILSYE